MSEHLSFSPPVRLSRMPDSAPPLTGAQHQGAALSLLSLSIAASNATPISMSLSDSAAPDAEEHHSWRGAVPEGPHITSQGVAVHNGLKHRRLSSTGQVRRRMSDARDAASRPSPVGLQAAAAALSSLAALSISSPVSPTTSLGLSTSAPRMSTAPVAIPSLQSPVARSGISVSASADDGFGVSGSPPPSSESKAGVTGTVTKGGKKRGTIFTCESCSKVYRHPSCLIKHRWEHTPHWREASKFLLSKHQQVQLMEAAAILSHLTPSASGGSSLPDDRSLWPSFLSGGALPPPSLPAPDPAPEAAHPTSSSVPTGPRMHDYALPSAGVSGITRLRPGIVAVPREPSRQGGAPQSYPMRYGSVGVSSSSFASSYQSSGAVAVQHEVAWETPDRWSRSFSLSRSDSRSSVESEFVEVDAPVGGFSARGRMVPGDEGGVAMKEEEEEEEWDGMDMEMEL
ncbi:hypothetical protein BC834DRAFT_969387 [Gloeopeniophorella convolvens]|nr:hypothetical protein BC834DRAFT_969387 [Gloeopeniophorella convolvens]